MIFAVLLFDSWLFSSYLPTDVHYLAKKRKTFRNQDDLVETPFNSMLQLSLKIVKYYNLMLTKYHCRKCQDDPMFTLSHLSSACCESKRETINDSVLGRSQSWFAMFYVKDVYMLCLIWNIYTRMYFSKCTWRRKFHFSKIFSDWVVCLLWMVHIFAVI